MALVIRLTKTGRKGEARFRVVVKEKRSRRDGKAIEVLGWFIKDANKKTLKVDKNRLEYWLSKGAKPTTTVLKLIS